MDTRYYYNELGDTADILLNGGLVAVPTETVYGLAAHGLNSDAVAKIYDVKGRPETKPINLLVSGIKDVEAFCREIPEEAYRLAEAFWPGPLTMILKKNDLVPGIVTAYGNTVGVRCPDHPLTLLLLQKLGAPLAVPSANPSGAKSPVSAGEVRDYFDGKIEAIIDGGECTIGVASTILDLTVSPIRVLRMGELTPEKILNETRISVCL